MDAVLFDKRRYPVVDAAAGYGEWAVSYEETVAAGLDLPLLESLSSVRWPDTRQVADLACGTGRTGAWLAMKGIGAIDGIDLTAQMLTRAAQKGVYRSLQIGDVARTPFAGESYDLCTMGLADEHLAELDPVYCEAARLLVTGGHFVLVGYHPFFLMSGLPTHFHRENGEAVTIRSYVHLFSEHYAAAQARALSLVEFRECVIDESWLETKPKWRQFLHWPVSFAMVWRRD